MYSLVLRRSKVLKPDKVFSNLLPLFSLNVKNFVFTYLFLHFTCFGRLSLSLMHLVGIKLSFIVLFELSLMNTSHVLTVYFYPPVQVNQNRNRHPNKNSNKHYLSWGFDVVHVHPILGFKNH